MPDDAAAASQSLATARDEYFRVNGFGVDGGYNAAWVDFKLGPVPMPFPNSKGRVRAVRFHDLHHVLTGYATDTLGEFEISAWEVASGCADFWVAWQLNLGGMLAGALSIPRRTWRAFMRGRHSRNLYRASYDDALLSRRVGEVQQALALAPSGDPLPKARAREVALFAGYLALGLVIGLASLAFVLPAAIFGNVSRALSARRSRSAPPLQ
jgi:hypothetical protein